MATQAQIEAADRLAVKIVSLVTDAVDREGELGAYEGIECARKIKEMILALTAAAEVEERSCTCHPADNPPDPCPKQYAYTECIKVATIERCAQRIREVQIATERDITAEECIDAVRSLKDQP